MNLKKYINQIPDFPKKNILFYDLSPMLLSAKAWQFAVSEISNIVLKMKPDIVAGIEARGFLISSAVATKLKLGSILIRKKGKTPGKIISYSYNLEYGYDTLEIQSDLLKKNQKIVILDDVLATGGTINAASELLKKAGAKALGAVCILKLESLEISNNINIPISSLLSF